jgi:16S rRNA (cytosine967-C5)-methyltransferase
VSAPSNRTLGTAELALATAAVAACLGGGPAPRDWLPAHGGARLPGAVRGAVVALANRVLGERRRLRCRLGLPDLATPLPPDREAAALVRLAAAARHEPAADQALAQAPDEHRFAIEHSLPDWLAAALQADFGPEAAAVASALLEAPPRTLRTNRLRRAGRAALAAELLQAGIRTEPTPFAPDGLLVAGDGDLFATAAYRDGAFEQQDEASQLGAWLTAPPPRGAVLDLCAGRGGKTLALAALLQNRGELLATDPDPRRLEQLRRRARAAGATNVRTVLLPDGGWPDLVADFARRADRVLVDAPCTGSGSLRRRPEARWRFGLEDFAALLRTQAELLATVASHLRPGARLVYTTCSLLRAENQDQITALLADRPELEPVRLAEVLGGAVAAPIADATGTFLSLRPDRHGCDGFFGAIVRRRR